MQDSVPEKCLQMLKSRDSEFAELDGPELETRVNKMVENFAKCLEAYQISKGMMIRSCFLLANGGIGDVIPQDDLLKE